MPKINENNPIIPNGDITTEEVERKEPQQVDFTEYANFHLKKEFLISLKKDSAEIQKIREYLAELEATGKTKCLECFQTFSQDKDKFDEWLVKNICPKCQAKSKEKIAREWRQFREKLGMPVGEEEKTWWEKSSPYLFPLFWIAFLAGIYFGWDKFWAWYESPLNELDWDWDEEDNIPEPTTEEPPTPPRKKNWWKWETWREWVKNNKMRTVLLPIIIGLLVYLVVKIVRLVLA